MINLGIVHVLISAVLFAIAIVVHVKAASLSLPIAPAISILAAVLPIASLLNAYIHPRMLRFSGTASASRLRQLIPAVLQTLQGLLTTILATLLFEGVVPSPALDCVLENEWMQRFRAHDGGTIRRIQDALNCCGFNSVKDRAFPFPKGAPSTCSANYGRTLPCKTLWREAMQRNSGIDFAIVIGVGVLQIVGLLIMREGTNWWTAWWARARNETVVHRESNRPLLTASAGDYEAAENENLDSRGYGGLNGNGSGPRVVPSPIDEGNAWDE